VAFFLLSPGVHSIEIGLSGGNRGESVSMSSNYDVDTGIYVNEEIPIHLSTIGISDTRSISGMGNKKVTQSYSGTGGYGGSASFTASGSGYLIGTTNLYPRSMSASQSVSDSGESANAGMSLTNGGTASVNCAMAYGSMAASQIICSTSALASSTAHINGEFGSRTTAGSASIIRPPSTGAFDLDLNQDAQILSTPTTFDHAAFYVNPSTKIQPAVDEALSDDTINVGPGTYYENIHIDKSLTINGAGAGNDPTKNTIVDGYRADSVSIVGQNNPSARVTLLGMTITGGTGNPIGGFGYKAGGGIWNAGIINLGNSIISGNTADLGGGIFNDYGGKINLNDGSIDHNAPKVNGGGIYNLDTINGRKNLVHDITPNDFNP